MTRNCLTLLFSFGIAIAGLAGPRADTSLDARGAPPPLVPLMGQTPVTDWPQWQGPDRNGLSRETGLLPQWPASGPPVAWSVSTLGGGYGSVAIKGDRMFVQGAKGGQSIVYALNRADGKPVWSKPLRLTD